MDVAITELEKIEADRIDGVGMPANGIPILLLKQVAEPVAKAPMDADGSTDGPTHGAFTGKHEHPHAGSDGETYAEEHSHDGDGDHGGHDHAAKSGFDREAAIALVKAIVGRKVDETPDIAGGTAVLAQIADLIIGEAQELKSGQAGEISDIQQLACAAEMIWCWRTGEEAVAAGSVMPATALMQSAMAIKQAAEEHPEVKMAVVAIDGRGATMEEVDEATKALAEHFAAKADMSTANINDLPDDAFAYIEPGGKKDEDGKTTPRSLRHFPVHDKAHAANALSRAPQSPFGDKAMPKIKAAAKKFGIGDDTSKSQIAKEDATVDTDAQTGGLAKAVEEAVTKATASLKERLEALGAELAKVKATPVPGGPVLSRNVQVKQPGAAVNKDYAAKAAYYREQASLWDSQDRATADGYRLKAREADAKAVTTPAT